MKSFVRLQGSLVTMETRVPVWLPLNPGGQLVVEWLSGCETDGDVSRLRSN